MIELENLHDKTALEIFNEAKQKIEFINPDWTYQEISDPGITILELLSWLKFDQHEYLNKISNRLRIKLLKLLGIKLKKRCGSKTLIQINNIKQDTDIPKNTKFKANNLIFENQENIFISKSDILSIKFNNPEFNEEKKYYDLNGTEKIQIFGEKNLKPGETREFIIKLSNLFPKNKKINIYFEIFEENSRNKINNNFFIPFAKIKWQYFGILNKIKAWHDFEFIDNTHEFLNSGSIILSHNGEMSSVNENFLIKCKLESSDYDFMPKVSKIKINIFEVTQQDTQCESIFIKKSDLKIKQSQEQKSIKFKTSSHLSLYGKHMLYIKNKNNWIIFERFKINQDIQAGTCEFEINNQELEQNQDFENLNQNDDIFLLVSYLKDFENKIIIGSGTGFSNLTFEQNFENLTLYNKCKIMIGEKNKKNLCFKIWNRVDDFFSSSKFDNNFVYEENLKIIAFGDNHHGAIPENEKNNIRFCELCFTNGQDSNIRENMIKDVETQNKILKNASINQILPATGGQDDEILEDGEKRALNLFKNIKRAVTAEDYIKIIKNTPGIMLKDVSIASSNQKLIQNKVYVAIKIPGKNYIPDSYKKNILNWFENFRLINTQIEILDPVIIKINLKIKIILKPGYSCDKLIIEKKLENFFEKINQKMGQPLIYGDLFDTIERFEFVDYLSNLEISSDTNNFENKSNYDNIEAPINGIYKLGKINLVSLLNTDI
ncbi:MAG: baseplate J/gp47 family protein [Clostridia bacterium]|nr:baseplate J/gp47 family protein [Clostridia bacterium]